MMDLWRDLRYALRSLRRSPGFALAAVMTLALGVGSSAALYSFVDAFLFRPLPFHEQDRLVHLWGTSREASYDKLRVSLPVARAWRERAHSFAGVALFNYTAQTLTGEEPLRVPSGRWCRPTPSRCSAWGPCSVAASWRARIGPAQSGWWF